MATKHKHFLGIWNDSRDGENNQHQRYLNLLRLEGTRRIDQDLKKEFTCACGTEQAGQAANRQPASRYQF